MSLVANPKNVAARISKRSGLRPTLAMVLGSGFHHALARLDVEVEIPYSKLPGFPKPGVAGHSGKLLLGRLGGTPLLVLSGRAHYYEGHPMERVTFPMRVLAACGIRDLLLTNAAGGINRKFRTGDFMVVTDHINLMGANPLRGEPVPGLPGFVDLTQTYDPGLSALLNKAARKSKLRLHPGVYLAVSGPTYETPAEIRAYARLGADAVGMSTVPEALVARQCGMKVAALSCISNLAPGQQKGPLSHEDVLKTAISVRTLAALLLNNFASLYGQTR